MSNNEAGFRIIGRIGKITRHGKVVRVNLSANVDVKIAEGKYETETLWNTVTVFGATADWVETHRNVGDLVHAKGSMGQAKYTNGNGETVYYTDFMARSLTFLGPARDKIDDEGPVGLAL